MNRFCEWHGDMGLTQAGHPPGRVSECAAVVRAGWIVFWVLLLGAMAANAQPGMPDRGNDEIARVNGVVITRQAFQIVYRQAVDRHAREGYPVDEAHLAPLRRKVIQRMVEEELLVQESRRQGITIASEEVDQDVAAARARFETPEGFQQELARLYLDETGYRRYLKRQKAIDRLLAQQVDPSVSVTPEEMRRFYEANPKRYQSPEKIRVRHILIRKEGGDNNTDPDAAYRKITMIREQLAQGGDFADLAAEFSQEPAREHGGDLGFIQRRQMPPSIESAVFGLEVGEISPILTTEQGYHLFQVTERRAAGVIPFEEARADIQKTLLQIKQKKAIRAYIAGLRKQAEIQTGQ
jgi:parvulin-like peptidyl-prolyl isomerase